MTQRACAYVNLLHYVDNAFPNETHFSCVMRAVRRYKWQLSVATKSSETPLTAGSYHTIKEQMAVVVSKLHSMIQ